MTGGDSPRDGGNDPTAAFWDELAEAFRRHRPQGTARWNFADAFRRLDALFSKGNGRVLSSIEPPPEPPSPPPPPAMPAPSPPGPVAALARRVIEERVKPPLRVHVSALTQDATVEVVRGMVEAVERSLKASIRQIQTVEECLEEGLGATREAFRFLAGRVAALEDASERSRIPVDATAWLAEPPDIDPWVEPVLSYLGAARRGEPGTENVTSELPVVHVECGRGDLVRALGSAGLAASGIEPRGALAWSAAQRGVDVDIDEAEGGIGRTPVASLGGVVLSGVVDRRPVGDLVALLHLVGTRLQAGAPLIVVGSYPGTEATGWSATARDLLPGRPLHPETWELLLGRNGYEQITRLQPVGKDLQSYAIAGRRR